MTCGLCAYPYVKSTWNPHDDPSQLKRFCQMTWSAAKAKAFALMTQPSLEAILVSKRHGTNEADYVIQIISSLSWYMCCHLLHSLRIVLHSWLSWGSESSDITSIMTLNKWSELNNLLSFVLWHFDTSIASKDGTLTTVASLGNDHIK